MIRATARPAPDADRLHVVETTYRGVPSSSRADLLSLRSLSENLYAARDREGRIALVVLLEGTPAASSHLYRGIAAKCLRSGEVRLGRRSFASAMFVVTCLDVLYEKAFFSLVGDALSCALAERSRFRSADGFASYLLEWADLFAVMRDMSRDEKVGLWAELEILLGLPDVERGFAAWHGPSAGTFDFAANRICLEVKASTAGHVHYFSGSQVTPPSAGVEVWIASVRLRDDMAGGRTLDDQVGRLRQAVSRPREVDRKIAGLGYIRGTSVERYSVGEVRFVPATQVPQPRQVDDDVLELRFRSSIASIPPLSRSASMRLGVRLMTLA